MIIDGETTESVDKTKNSELMEKWKKMVQCVRYNEPPYCNKSGRSLGVLWLHLASYMAHRVKSQQGDAYVPPTGKSAIINNCQVMENKEMMKNFLMKHLRIITQNDILEVCVRGCASKFKLYMKRNAEKEHCVAIANNLPFPLRWE